MYLNSYIAKRNPTLSQRIAELKLSEIGWLLVVNCLIFESFLTKNISIANYFDEAATIALFSYALLHAASSTNKKLLSSTEKLSIAALVLLVCVGVFGGFISKIQTNPFPILIDIFACIKFPVAILSGYIVFANSKSIFEVLVVEAKLLLVVMVPFAIMNQFLDMGMRFDSRYGLDSFQFVFGHPSSLAAVMAAFSVLFFAVDRDGGRWLILCWIYLILTLRSAAIAFAAFSCLAWLISRKKGRINLWQIALFTIVALFFGWSQIQYYFVDLDGSARRELLDVGIKIADYYFPFGSGFATYASNITSQAEFYSPLYYEYGLSGIYGLTLDNSNFLSDSFWPIIIGQFGWIGMIAAITVILSIYFGCCTRLKKLNQSTLPISIGFAYLLITSASSSAFFHPLSVLIAAYISLTVCYQLKGAPEP